MKGVLDWHKIGAMVLIAGCLFGLSGLVQAQNHTVPEGTWRVLLAQPGIRVGPADAVVDVQILFDPNCPFCHELWLALRPYEARGLAIRWVPVAYFSTSSAGIAAAILTASDPAGRLKENEERYDIARQQGGIAPLASIPSRLRSELSRTTRLWATLGGMTPLMLYRTRDGKIHPVPGLLPPADLKILMLGIQPRLLTQYRSRQ